MVSAIAGDISVAMAQLGLNSIDQIGPQCLWTNQTVAAESGEANFKKTTKPV